MRSMFDAIAPRYDLVNRIMTFRMDVGWRKRTVRDLRLGPGSRRADLACGTGDFCRELEAPGPAARSGSTSPSACSPTPAPRPRSPQADVLAPAACPTRRSTASPAGSPCATWSSSARFFAELARVVRPGGRIALLEVAEPAEPGAAVRPRHLLRQGRAHDRRPAVRPGAPTATCPSRSPTCPSPRRCWPRLADAGFVHVERTPAVHRHLPADHRHPTSRAGERTDACAGLVARTRPLDSDPDLLGGRRATTACCSCTTRTGLAGVGVAARIALPRSGGRADADAVADGPRGHRGRRPVDAARHRPGGPRRPAVRPVGAGRADRARASSSAAADDGTRWVTTIAAPTTSPRPTRSTPSWAGGSPARSGFARDAGLTPADEGPATYELRSERSPADWCEAVAETTRRIRAGEARKVVLAREVDVVTDRAAAGRRRARPAAAARTRRATCFSVDGFVGATPELLVARAGDRVRAHPMAGTAPRSGDPDHRRPPRRGAAGLQQEPRRAPPHHRHGPRHAAAVVLVPRRGGRAVDRGHGQRAAPRHPARGQALRARPASVLELVTALHPTPAVGGAPGTSPWRMIAELERLDRGRYAGPVGWVDAAGNGTWAVGIRCGRARRHHRPGVRRRRRGRRLRPGLRAGRDPGQAAGRARGRSSARNSFAGTPVGRGSLGP